MRRGVGSLSGTFPISRSCDTILMKTKNRTAVPYPLLCTSSIMLFVPTCASTISRACLYSTDPKPNYISSDFLISAPLPRRHRGCFSSEFDGYIPNHAPPSRANNFRSSRPNSAWWAPFGPLGVIVRPISSCWHLYLGAIVVDSDRSSVDISPLTSLYRASTIALGSS